MSNVLPFSSVPLVQRTASAVDDAFPSGWFAGVDQGDPEGPNKAVAIERNACPLFYWFSLFEEADRRFAVRAWSPYGHDGDELNEAVVAVADTPEGAVEQLRQWVEALLCGFPKRPVAA